MPHQISLDLVPEDFSLAGNDHQTRLEAEFIKAKRDAAPVQTVPRPLALVLFAMEYSAERGAMFSPDCWHLSGDRNKQRRQQFMQLLTGEAKPRPLARCGVTELSKLLYALCPVPFPADSCEAGRAQIWATWASETLAKAREEKTITPKEVKP